METKFFIPWRPGESGLVTPHPTEFFSLALRSDVNRPVSAWLHRRLAVEIVRIINTHHAAWEVSLVAVEVTYDGDLEQDLEAAGIVVLKHQFPGDMFAFLLTAELMAFLDEQCREGRGRVTGTHSPD